MIKKATNSVSSYIKKKIFNLHSIAHNTVVAFSVRMQESILGFDTAVSEWSDCYESNENGFVARWRASSRLPCVKCICLWHYYANCGFQNNFSFDEFFDLGDNMNKLLNTNLQRQTYQL